MHELMYKLTSGQGTRECVPMCPLLGFSLLSTIHYVHPSVFNLQCTLRGQLLSRTTAMIVQHSRSQQPVSSTRYPLPSPGVISASVRRACN